jgi:hypothetical protein
MLLGHPVDVPEAELVQPTSDRNRQVGVRDLPCQLVQARVEEPAVAHAVRTDQGMQRHVPLGQSSRVLQRSGRSVDALRDDPVLEDVQQGRDVGLHARREEIHDHVVAPELGDGADRLLAHLLADLDHPHIDPCGHARQQLIDGRDDDVQLTMLGIRAGESWAQSPAPDSRFPR